MAVSKFFASHPVVKDFITPVAYINGKFIENAASTIAVRNPATHDHLGNIPNLGKVETKEAIQVAHEALKEWQALLPQKRSHMLRDLAIAMRHNSDALATIMTAECGKPKAEALGENQYSAGYVEWYAGEVKRVCGDVMMSSRPGVRTLVFKQPVGVVGIITPWNFPSAMITRSAAAALAAGCTVVIKPSELTPFSAGALAKLVEQVGIPKGVFNIVTGDAAPIGDAMVESELVRKLCFTGSTRVGKHLMEKSAGTVKKLAMELGGNAPFIVFEDADIDAAVNGAMASKFRNAGQTCVCANRFFVHERVAKEFTEKFAAKIKQSLHVGDGLAKGITMGPLINQAACDKMEQLVKEAVAEGAEVVVGGKKKSDAPSTQFFEPTILTNVKPTMRVAREEIFGPVAPIMTFKSDEEVVKAANDVPAGLASYFFTNSYKRQWKVSEGLHFGMVGVNEGIMSSNVAPFGGVKQSGLGRDGSKYGIDGFLDIKYVCMGGDI